MATDSRTIPTRETFDPVAALRRLERMGAERRLRAYRSGHLTHAELVLWTAHFPEEVPIVNDEIEWIALNAE